MPNLNIADYLKYANLQMAAEAFLFNEATQKIEVDIAEALKLGNKHASVFTSTQAAEFISQWEVVAQQPNTPTGFSGTLFRCKMTDASKGLVEGQLVLSFRSTEFLDDAIRDSAATNSLEVFDTGFAWGQIADMEKWYGELKASGKLSNPDGDPLGFSVTGYSLGGHLATAFHMMHQGDTIYGGGSVVKEVVTFNGAGVGEMTQGDLKSALNYFQSLRAEPAACRSGFNPTRTPTIPVVRLKPGLPNFAQAQAANRDGWGLTA
jgi:hypothetical protein